MAEIKGQTSVIIQVPAAQVYQYLLDFTRHPEWSQNLQKVTPLSAGSVGEGAIFRTSEGPPPLSSGQKAKMMFFFILGLLSGAKPYSEARITALEPDRRIAWQARLPRREGDFNRAAWEIILQPQNGSTLLTQRFEYSPQSWAARHMVGSAEGIERACAANLARLKTVLEQGQMAVQARSVSGRGQG
jgi:uncharacterized membrane protein